MAEAFAHTWAPEVEVLSAASDIPDEYDGKLVKSISGKGIQSMKEIGIDTSKAIVKKITPLLSRKADIIISMVPRDMLPSYVKDSPKLKIWEVKDPGGFSYETHTNIRDIITEKIKVLIKELSL